MNVIYLINFNNQRMNWILALLVKYCIWDSATQIVIHFQYLNILYPDLQGSCLSYKPNISPKRSGKCTVQMWSLN